MEAIFTRYPALRQNTAYLAIERNTSHAHAALIGQVIENHFAIEHNVNVVVLKELGKGGVERMGIMTRNKGSLVHLAQLVLDGDLVELNKHITSVGNSGAPNANVLDNLRSQLASYRRIIKAGGKCTLTGKSNEHKDDLATAFILFLSWSCYVNR